MKLVDDLNPGTPSSNARATDAALGSAALVAANDGATGNELYTYTP